MFEKAGLSSLERLIGRDVSAVCFVRTYVQLIFEDVTFTCYTCPSVSISEKRFETSSAGYRDALCGLIGQTVQSVLERPRKELTLDFESGDRIEVSLRFEDSSSVEAAMLHATGGEIFDVWRYE